MVKIEITKPNLFNSKGERVAVGTVMTLDKEPTGWKNKYRVLSDDSEKELTAASADGEGGGGDPDADADEVTDELKAEYERVIGKKPHHLMKAPKMREKIAEAVGNGDNGQ